MSNYPRPASNLPPLSYQVADLEATWQKTAHGWRWPTGTRKTWQAIMTASWLHAEAKIDGVVVVAPPGVDLQWLEEQLPAHLPPPTAAASRYLRWSSGKAQQVGFKKDYMALVGHSGLSWLVMTFPAFVAESAKKAYTYFLDRRRTLVVLDQSLNIKTPGAKRTKFIVKVSKRALYRRILEGTMSPEGPFDVYSQLRFLSPEIWAARGLPRFSVFKQYFGEFLSDEQAQQQRGYVPAYPVLLAYRNLPELAQIIAENTSCVDKSVLGLPPESYAHRPFDLSPAHRRAYDALRDEMYLELASGRAVAPDLAIVLMTRLQQVSRGYVGVLAAEPVERLPGEPASLGVLQDLLAELGNEQVVIWARFRMDVDLIQTALGSDKVARYDGAVDTFDRELAKARFLAGERQYFLATPAAGGVGLNLQVSSYSVFYSYGHRLVHFLEPKDRIWRSGQTRPVVHNLLVASDTIDLPCVKSWERKLEVAAQLDGAALRSILK